MRLSDGRPAVISEVTDKQITVDANHPLSGEPISIEVEVLESTPESEYETAAFAMGCYWCEFAATATAMRSGCGGCYGTAVAVGSFNQAP